MAEKQDITEQTKCESGKFKNAPIFNELAHCAKCGSSQIKSSYVNDEEGERIQRACERCGFTWPERCLDDQA